MSERRLPVLGAPVDAMPAYAPLPTGARFDPGVVAVSIVAASAGLSEHADRFARELLDALAARGARARALQIEVSHVERSLPPGVDTPDGHAVAWLAAPEPELVARVQGEVAALGDVDALVVLGAAFPGFFRPRLAVLITDGLASPSWSPEARAIRDRIDLELSDPRSGVARGLAEVVLRV